MKGGLAVVVFGLRLLLCPAARPRHTPSDLGPWRTVHTPPLVAAAAQSGGVVQASGLLCGSEAFGAHPRVGAAADM